MLSQLIAMYMALAFVPKPAECVQEIAYFDQGLTDDGHTPYGPESACAAAYFDDCLALDESYDWRAGLLNIEPLACGYLNDECDTTP